MEEAPLVFLVTVSCFHISLFKLKTLPQKGILNPFNLMVENTLYNVLCCIVFNSFIVLTLEIN